MEQNPSRKGKNRKKRDQPCSERPKRPALREWVCMDIGNDVCVYLTTNRYWLKTAFTHPICE